MTTAQVDNYFSLIDRVVRGVAAIPGLRILGAPAMPLLAIGADVGVFRLSDRLRRRGWI